MMTVVIAARRGEVARTHNTGNEEKLNKRPNLDQNKNLLLRQEGNVPIARLITPGSVSAIAFPILMRS